MPNLFKDYSDGSKFTGEFNSSGQRHGVGRLQLADSGGEYVGEWLEGYPSGLGCVHFSDGSRFAGEFVAGRPHGSGVWSSAGSSLSYVGQFFEGKPQGAGRMKFADGTAGVPRHEGWFQANQLIKRAVAEERPALEEEARRAETLAQRADQLAREITAEN